MIVQVLPETSHERQYRIKGTSSRVERVVREMQIKGIRSRWGNLQSSRSGFENERMAHLVWC
jgi:hypothetical protein